MRFQFTIMGKPQAWQRVSWGKHGSYVPKETLCYEQEVWVAALKAGLRQLTFGSKPLWLGVQVFTYCKVKKPKNRLYPISPREGGDLDNYVKCAMDGLRPAFIDDGQIVGFLPCSKQYGDPERMEIVVTDVPDGSLRCENCDGIYTPIRKDQKFCSPECALPAKRKAKLKWWNANRRRLSDEEVRQ